MATYPGPMDTNPPFFMQESGAVLTKGLFNELLKYLLAPYVQYGQAYVSLHSFREGLVNHLMSLGYSEDQARQAGR